jgi:hypothetical protein
MDQAERVFILAYQACEASVVVGQEIAVFPVHDDDPIHLVFDDAIHQQIGVT